MLDLTSTDVPGAASVSNPDETQFVPRAPAPKTKSKLNQRSATLLTSSADAYAKDVRLFEAAGGTIPCDGPGLMEYILANRTKLSPSTLYRRALAVQHGHLSLGIPSPTHDSQVRGVLRALQRGYVPDKKALYSGAPLVAPMAKRRVPQTAAPVTRKLLLQVFDAMGRNLLDRRDRALLLLGFMGAFKRGTLVAIRVGDLRFTSDALIVRVRALGDAAASDVNPNADSQVAVPMTQGELCAVTAVREWSQMAGLDMEATDRHLFRRFDRGGNPTPFGLDSGYVNAVLKGRLKTVGVDPAKFSGQSLRVGRLSEIGKGTL